MDRTKEDIFDHLLEAAGSEDSLLAPADLEARAAYTPVLCPCWNIVSRREESTQTRRACRLMLWSTPARLCTLSLGVQLMPAPGLPSLF